MLVLSRQRDETIMIGDDIEITVVDIRGDKVRLGITAPPLVPVHRKEVYEAIKRENRDAARMTPEGLSAVLRTKVEADPSGKFDGIVEIPVKQQGDGRSRRGGRNPRGKSADSSR